MKALVIIIIILFTEEIRTCSDQSIMQPINLITPFITNIDSVMVQSSPTCYFNNLDSQTTSLNCQLSQETIQNDNFIIRHHQNANEQIPNYLITPSNITSDVSDLNEFVDIDLESDKSREIQLHFENLKKTFIQMIENSENFTPERRLFYQERLENLSLNMDTYQSNNRNTCLKKFRYLNAELRVSEVIMQCGSHNLPISSIVTMLSHEIAHSLDDCLLRRLRSHERLVPSEESNPFTSIHRCIGQHYPQDNDCSKRKTEHFADVLGSSILNEYFHTWRPPRNTTNINNLLLHADRQHCKEVVLQSAPTGYPNGIQRINTSLAYPNLKEYTGCQDHQVPANTCTFSF